MHKIEHLKLKKTALLFIIISHFTYGQAFRSFSNEFLNLGVGADAFGMGKAVIASTNDVNAVYWNPAGLVHVKDHQGALMHAEYYQGIGKYDYAGYATPINDKSAFAVSLIRFGVDDIMNTTELIDSQGNINYNNISLFSAADYALTVGYARTMLFKGFDVGLNGKIVRRHIGDFANSWGFGLDAAMQYQTESNWKFGLMLRDITTTFNAWSIDQEEFEKISNTIPGENQEQPETLELTKPKIQFGVGKSFYFSHDISLLTEVDLNMRFSETNDLISTSFISIDPAIGFQLDYLKIVYLRAGVNNFQNFTEIDDSSSLSVEPNVGIGFRYKGIYVDYALANIGGASGTLFSNIFSLKVNFEYFK